MCKDHTEYRKIINSTNKEIAELNEELKELSNKRVGALLDKNSRLSKKEISNIDNRIDIINATIKDKKATINAAQSLILEEVLSRK